MLASFFDSPHSDRGASGDRMESLRRYTVEILPYTTILDSTLDSHFDTVLGPRRAPSSSRLRLNSLSRRAPSLFS